MYRINIVCVGKIKEEFYRSAVAEYLKRLSRFARVEIHEIAEGRSVEEEAPAILRAVKGYTVALCIEGKKLDSAKFADEVGKALDKFGELTFIIGSSCGLAQKVKDAAHLRLSFSDMTFPHRLMRVILCEQIYRAFMINGGGEYHK